MCGHIWYYSLSNSQSRKIVDYLEIYRKGENEFYFLLPPKINNRQIVKGDGTTQLIEEQTQPTGLKKPESVIAVKKKNR